MNYRETLDYLYKKLPMFQRDGNKALKPKLTNITLLCENLGNPQNDFKSIHIAGTNGKGSSSHFLASILQESQYKVGLYTSPHLKDYRERFKINGKNVPEDYVVKFIEENKLIIEELRPSFFEISVALAFKYFSDEKVDVAVIEVGLGGRLDSTNIISNKELSLITNIGYDHTNVLGNTLPKIATEKAGIIKFKVPVVISEYNDETRQVFESVAEQNHSKIFFAQDLIEILKIDETLDSLTIWIKDGTTVLEIASGLVGDYQKYNILGVYQAVKVLKEQLKYDQISETSILTGFKKVIKNTDLKGRWQILGRNPLVICDTGHNEHAFNRTINKLKNFKSGNLHFVLGFVRDKNLNLIQDIIPKGSKLYLSTFSSDRALKPAELKELKFHNANLISISDSVNIAIQSARREAKENDIIFVGGSTYLVAEINEL